MYIPNHHKHALKGLLIIGGLGFVSHWLFTSIYGIVMRKRMKDRRDRKQKDKAQALLAFKSYLDQNPMPKSEIDMIVSKPFMALVDLLKSGEFNPKHVLLAYQHKAFEVNKICNCVVEFLYPNFDEINLNGPLAGVPVSVKDNFTIKGCESSIGLASFLNGPSNHDAVIIRVIKSLGGIPFVRTNVPQTMLTIMSSNPIDGTTFNPLNLTKSPGGSSSGEAALVGGGGSCLGFGTDLGGSIRLPAAWCGIVGFKPTSSRISQIGMTAMTRFMTVSSCSGFLARDVETCIAVAQAIWNSSFHKNLDYSCPPLTYTEEFLKTETLRIGYFTTYDSFVAVPAVQRAVIHVKEKLETLGHKLLPWKPPFSGEECLRMFLEGIFVDGGQPVVDEIKYDKVEPSIKGTIAMFKTRNVESYHFITACSLVHNIRTLCEHELRLENFREQLYASLRENYIDAIISPVCGLASPIPVDSKCKFTGLLTYLNLYNAANMPAGCVPSGIKVNEADLVPLKAARLKVKFNTAPYPMDKQCHKTAVELQLDSVGFPVSVQVAAPPWRDEVCLHVMREIEKAVSN